jgi:hypothetical protein
MKQIEYYSVVAKDLNGGPGRELIGNFSTLESAEKVKSRISFYQIYKNKFTLFESSEEFDQYTNNKIRERVLAKLTKEEKIALGFQA